jgi:hypothetical protein
MVNNEMRRLKTQLHDQINVRMDRFEKKLDTVIENCGKCAREFGTNGAEIANLKEAHREHLATHRWRAGLAASIGGILVALGNVVFSWLRNRS